MSIIKELVTDLNPVGICELEFTLAFKDNEKKSQISVDILKILRIIGVGGNVPC